MRRNKYSPPSFSSDLVLLTPFKSKKDAELWLKNNRLDTNDTPLLIPFENQTDGRIEFLKPAGDRLRIMGAANCFTDKKYTKKSLNWFTDIFSRDFIPHIDHLEGDTIRIEENRAIIIYEKGVKPVGQKFAKLFRVQIKKLKAQIEAAQTNDAPRLEPAEIIQDLSKLALGLEIKAGMSYFIERKDGIENVYRHTFNKDAANDNLKLYLKTETEKNLSTPVHFYNDKIENNHYYTFCIDWMKGTIFAIVTAIGSGFVSSIFLPVFITGPIAVIAFIVLSVFAFYQASEDNPKTMDFGVPEIRLTQPNGVTTTISSVSAYQAGGMPAIQRSAASMPQQCLALPRCKKDKGKISKEQAVAYMPGFFNRSTISTFLKKPVECVATVVKALELEPMVRTMVKPH